MSQISGETVEPAQIVSVTVGQKLTETEFRALQAEEFDVYARRFAKFSVARASIMAAWLFAPIRDRLELDNDFTELIEAYPIKVLGAIALDDESWAILEEKWLAADGEC